MASIGFDEGSPAIKPRTVSNQTRDPPPLGFANFNSVAASDNYVHADPADSTQVRPFCVGPPNASAFGDEFVVQADFPPARVRRRKLDAMLLP